MTDNSTRRQRDRSGVWLSLVLAAYLVAAIRFALYTPAWQAPDEPAHYNYISYIAHMGHLPILRSGDYSQAYIEKLVSQRFPKALSIAPLRYESHQPPLYYLLALPIYWIGNGSLVALRLYSVVIGAGTVLLVFLCARLIFPNFPSVSLAAAAFTAFLPMHVAMSSAVNNDGLAELIITAGILVLLRWARERLKVPPSQPMQPQHSTELWLLGCLIGLGFLTKATAYVLLPLALLIVLLVETVCHPAIEKETKPLAGEKLSADPRWFGYIHSAVGILIPAFVIGLPWWLRNMTIYSFGDFLGLARHSQVVVGQPDTFTWIATYGLRAYLERAMVLTFESFWGVFGWMTTVMSDWIYWLFVLFVFLIIGGLALAYWHRRKIARSTGSFQRVAFWSLVGLLALVFSSYVWYNLGFVQHQGRYLFPGILALSIGVAIGWRDALCPLSSIILGGVTAVVVVSLAVLEVGGMHIGGRLLLSLALSALLLLINGALVRLSANCESRARTSDIVSCLHLAVWSGPFLLMLLLDLAAPTLYLVPFLS